MKIIPVILSGGTGSRLWPLSRAAYPKQLLNLTGSESLIQQTVKRVKGIPSATAPVIVCNERHRFLIAEQLQQIGVEALDIILEPVGRNTAPAIAVAALRVMQDFQDALLLVLPADHLIGDVEKFYKTIEKGSKAAYEGKLVTFGIVPSKPETGYGYIRRGNELDDGLYKLKEFVEKPDLETAKKYLESGEYLWNSGMFLFRPQTYINELEKFQPQMTQCCQKALENAIKDLDFLRLERDAFKKCPSDSIDYAVMEKTKEAIVVELDSSWSDIGSWNALWEVGEKDNANNVVRGDVIAQDVSESLLISQKRLLAVLGVKDIVAIETPDAVLIANRFHSQEIKKIVSFLKENKREEYLFHSKVYRPWGSYEGLVSGERFQVKLIIVKPGAKLSVQMHHHRAEHWIIVRGTAKILKGDEEILLTENQSTFIPLGTVHSLENPGRIPLELIEVQSGPYLGEDDIVRIKDIYGRIENKEDENE